MKKLLIVLFSILLLAGCGNKVEEKNKLQEIKNENNYTIVDVRTPEEYQEGHLKDALNIPYDTIDESINLDKNKTILVYCKSGARSKKAYNSLTNLGYKVYDMGAYDKINEFEKVK